VSLPTVVKEPSDDPTLYKEHLLSSELDLTGRSAVVTGASSGIVRAMAERLSDEVLERAQEVLSDIMIKPEDVANAVVYSLSQPPWVHLSEIVVRPNKDFDL
jgi:NADP-dependent 3-hydroxy acid dehydrogenase YdfG